MTTELPTWHTDGTAAQIDFVVFVYNRSDGFAFCPTNLPLPFFCGGDGYAHGPLSAESGLGFYQHDMSRQLRKQIGWFVKYMG